MIKMQEIIAIAKEKGITYKVGVSKADLIRMIQAREGYTSCYQRQNFCDEKECRWMDDCVPKNMIFS